MRVMQIVIIAAVALGWGIGCLFLWWGSRGFWLGHGLRDRVGGGKEDPAMSVIIRPCNPGQPDLDSKGCYGCEEPALHHVKITTGAMYVHVVQLCEQCERQLLQALPSFGNVVEAALKLLSLTAETSKLRAYGIDTTDLTMANMRLIAALADIQRATVR